MSTNEKPLVSIILLTYNQENLVTEAVESLLAQTYTPLEIILSDDASTDNTFTVMKKLANNYQGQHIIKLNQNTTNLGICLHINKAVSLTQGELIFHAAGDDISLPDRCEKVVSVWLAHNKTIDLIATDAFDMNFSGEILGIKKTDDLEKWRSIDDWFIKRPYIFGASHTWSRNLIKQFGTIDYKISVEDQTMTFRAVLTGSALTISEPLVKHRRGGLSQKEKYIMSVYTKQQELMAGNFSNLEFITQCIKDAKVIGIETFVELKFKNTFATYQMIDKLFKSDSIFEKIKLAVLAKHVNFSKKIRFLIYAGFPQLLMPLFFIKIKLNKI